MNRVLFVITILFCLSCSQERKEEKAVTQKETGNKSLEEANAKTANPKEGISEKLYGEWINTSLFDSTLAQRKLYPWLNEFYGDLYLTINRSDSLNIGGNMDGGDVKVNFTDEFHFSTTDRIDNPTFAYLPDRDLILLKTKNYSVLFRRIRKSDARQIIGNEEKFNRYFIDKFFVDDYFKGIKKPMFTTVWNGFETFTPFDFDAVGIENEKGEIEYFGWEFRGDTLKLYSTSFKEDDESGFLLYNKGSLTRKYVRKN